MTIQQRIFAQIKDGTAPETGKFIIQDSTEVVETGFPIGAVIRFIRAPADEGMVSYRFEPAIPAA